MTSRPYGIEPSLREARRITRTLFRIEWTPEALTATYGRYQLTVSAPCPEYPPSHQLGQWFWQVWRMEHGKPVSRPDGEVASGRAESMEKAKLEAIRHLGAKAQREWKKANNL